jgi:hypothetical protein
MHAIQIADLAGYIPQSEIRNPKSGRFQLPSYIG